MPPILPPGTKVVFICDTPDATRGTVATVIRQPSELGRPYRVRLLDDRELTVRGQHLTTLAKFTTESDRVADGPLWECVALRCIIGSRAYGLETEDSDIDRRGFYVPPADRHWSLAGVPEQLECHETQESYWEAGKFLRLALKANPNVLECLFSDLVEHASPAAERLLAIRDRFLSQRLYQTMNGYVLSQFKKMRTARERTGSFKNKHAMHLLRLLLTGIEAMRTGEYPLRVPQHRDFLLSVRRGELDWDALETFAPTP